MASSCAGTFGRGSGPRCAAGSDTRKRGAADRGMGRARAHDRETEHLLVDDSRAVAKRGRRSLSRQGSPRAPGRRTVTEDISVQTIALETMGLGLVVNH